jgi:hypothetical protein
LADLLSLALAASPRRTVPSRDCFARCRSFPLVGIGGEGCPVASKTSPSNATDTSSLDQITPDHIPSYSLLAIAVMPIPPIPFPATVVAVADASLCPTGKRPSDALQNHRPGRRWCWQNSLDRAGGFHTHSHSFALYFAIPPLVVPLRRARADGSCSSPCPPSSKWVRGSATWHVRTKLTEIPRHTIRPSRTAIASSGSWMISRVCSRCWIRRAKVGDG